MRYRLGLPAWAFSGWRGNYFDNSGSMLASYASVFNAVEGNTSFYHVPNAASVTQWGSALENTDCKISFKLPKSVTHNTRIDWAEFDACIDAVQPLRPFLGPWLIQLPARIGPNEIDTFHPVFEQLAKEGKGVLEVRHHQFFAEPETLEEILNTYQFGRVILDSRSLYQGNQLHPEVINAIHEKPDVPIIPTVYSNTAFVRLVLHPDGTSNVGWIDEWVETVGRWLSEGVDVTVMIHCPNNQHCPPFARIFHEQLQRQYLEKFQEVLTDLPAWPVPQQGNLF